ncbi:MAG: riboflavin synthase, alpha subunit [Dehalococcoidia bacterium]|nr:riboflavin synthase, alpha subunit [Dehalococcoidia bacterium]
MFTGIVQEMGKTRKADGSSLTVEARLSLEGLREGESIAVNGTCLTVTAIGEGCFSVDTMPETMRRTNLGLLKPGDQVNLERAPTLSSYMGGHLVQGHVDAPGTLVSMEREGEALLMKFQAPPQVMKYVVEKGFIAVDGVSLTVAAYDASTFTISVVKYTQDNTNLGHRKCGDVVNLEVDILAKYVERLLSAREAPGS